MNICWFIPLRIFSPPRIINSPLFSSIHPLQQIIVPATNFNFQKTSATELNFPQYIRSMINFRDITWWLLRTHVVYKRKRERLHSGDVFYTLFVLTPVGRNKLKDFLSILLSCYPVWFKNGLNKKEIHK